MLAPREVVLRLVRCGLIDADTLLHGGVTLDDASHRNHDVTVRRRGKAVLFVKQPGQRDSDIDHEGEVYRTLRTNPALSRFLPALRFAEPGFLVLGAVRGETLAARSGRTHRVPRKVASDLGRALAHLHDSGAAIPIRSPVPWILSLGAPPLEILTIASAAHLDILRIVQRSGEICGGLQEVAGDYRADTPVHNDVRFENCLLEPRNGRTALKLVDWELAAMGDPGWDVGSALAAFAALWLFSFRYAPGMSVAEITESATTPLERTQPAALAFWRTYAARRTLDRAARAALLARSFRYAAARLLQLSWERSLHATRAGAEVVCAIQASANLFADRDTAASLLLGQRWEDLDA